MSTRVTEIVGFDPEAFNTVLLRNFYKYQWQLFNATSFRARDQRYPAEEFDGANMLFIAGEKQLYRGFIGDIDVAESTVNETRSAQEQLRTFVAKRNRTTGTMRLVEVTSCQLSHVSHDRNPQLKSSAEQLNLGKIKKLLGKFESKVSQKKLKRLHGQHFDLGMMEKKLRQMKADCVLNDGITTAKAEEETSDYELMRKEIQGRANPNATSLRDLFRVQDLIDADLLRQLTEAATLLLQIPPEELSMANEYLDNRVKALMQSPEMGSERNLSAARVCLFMDALARLIGPEARRIIGVRGNISPYAPVLNEPIRRQFLQHGWRTNIDRSMVTRYTRDKALLYYIAFVFVLEGTPRVSAKVIHQSVQVDKRELIIFARAIGASYSRHQDVFSKGQLYAPVSTGHDIQGRLKWKTIV